MNEHECKQCGGELVLLGSLGPVCVCRCRQCGLDQTANIEDEEN